MFLNIWFECFVILENFYSKWQKRNSKVCFKKMVTHLLLYTLVFLKQTLVEFWFKFLWISLYMHSPADFVMFMFESTKKWVENLQHFTMSRHAAYYCHCQKVQLKSVLSSSSERLTRFSKLKLLIVIYSFLVNWVYKRYRVFKID